MLVCVQIDVETLESRAFFFFEGLDICEDGKSTNIQIRLKPIYTIKDLVMFHKAVSIF